MRSAIVTPNIYLIFKVVVHALRKRLKLFQMHIALQSLNEQRLSRISCKHMCVISSVGAEEHSGDVCL